MTLQVEFWHLVSLLFAFLGFVVTTGKILLTQIDQRLNERFESIAEAQRLSEAHAEAKSIKWQSLEKDFLLFKAELPLQYVRRDDWVRNQSIIEAKLDGLAIKIENLQIKGN